VIDTQVLVTQETGIPMRNYLVVANQTIGGAALRKELDKRIEAGPSSFYVLVPNTSAAHYHVVPAAGGVLPMPTMVTSYDAPATEEEATAEARERLDKLVSNLTAKGVEAQGHLGGAHPLEAIEEALAERTFDEIILSTLPHRVSRWLQADLPHQVERRWNVPVTTVISRH
jgi:nucleotide-binding universal stress UspA family protein